MKKIKEGLLEECKSKTYIEDEKSYRFGRHLNFNEIRLLAINRILNQGVINSRPPLSFLHIYNSYPEERRKYLLEDCQHSLSRAGSQKSLHQMV